MELKKVKLMAVTMVGALTLMACSADTENKEDKGTDEDTVETSNVEFGDVLATINGEEFGSDSALNSLIEDGIIPNDAVVQKVLDEILNQYYPVTDEEVDAKLAEITKFEEESGNTVDEEYLAQNMEYIKQSAQMQKALSDVVEVTDEQKDALYEEMKTKYDVVDILVFDEKGKEEGQKILEEVKGASEEELEKIVDKYSENQDIHVDIMSYAKGEIPVEDTTQLEDFTEAGDVIETEGESAYNVILLQDVNTLERDAIEDRLEEAALYENVSSTYDIIKLLEEKHTDLKLSDEVKEMLEQSSQPEETGVQGEGEIEEGVQTEEGSEEIDEDALKEAIEEEEGTDE